MTASALHLTRKTKPQPGDTRYSRSAVTNGRVLLPGVDGRNLWVRRARDIIAAHLADLGGEDNTSAAERSIIRRASILTVELERLEIKFALAGEASERDLDLYQRTAGNLRRLFEAVGLQRRLRDVTPQSHEQALEQLAAELNAEEEAEKAAAGEDEHSQEPPEAAEPLNDAATHEAPP